FADTGAGVGAGGSADAGEGGAVMSFKQAGQVFSLSVTGTETSQCGQVIQIARAVGEALVAGFGSSRGGLGRGGTAGAGSGGCGAAAGERRSLWQAGHSFSCTVTGTNTWQCGQVTQTAREVGWAVFGGSGSSTSTASCTVYPAGTGSSTSSASA